MEKTITRKNLSYEDAHNIADELKIYGYTVEIAREGNRWTVAATK